MNTQAGADAGDIQQAFAEAYLFLSEHPFGSTLTEKATQNALILASTLEFYNTGQIGPGPCASEIELAQTIEAVRTATGKVPTRTPKVTLRIPTATQEREQPEPPKPSNTPIPPPTEQPTDPPTQLPPTPIPPTEPPPTEDVTPTVVPPLSLSTAKVFQRPNEKKASDYPKAIDSEMQISKSAEPNPVVAGTFLTYTVTVFNNGIITATGVTITDTLPAGVTFQSASAGCVYSAGDVICNVGEMITDTQQSRTILVQVNSGITGTLTNAATVGSETIDPIPDNNKATVDTTVITVADLQLGKSGSPGTVIAGNLLTYTLSLTNTGPSDAQGVSITDTLPSGVTFQSASIGCSHTAGQVVCTVGSLAAAANTSRTIVVRVNPSTLTTPLTNSATADSTTIDPIPANNTATVDTTVTTEADLQLGKSGSPGTVIAGNLLIYTLSLTNIGPSDAQVVIITDTLPSGVTFQSTSVGCSHTAGQVVCTVGGLAVTANINRTIVVRVNASTLTSPLTNSATADSTTLDPVPGNNTATVDTTVTTEADLLLVKSAWPNPVIAGNLLTYTLSLTNIGPSDAQGVIITDPLPSGVTFQSASAGCIHTAGQVVCTVGGLAATADASRVITVRVNPSTLTTPLTNSATANATTADPIPGNNTTTVNTTVITQADLQLGKSGLPGTVIAGNLLTYTLSLINAGPSNALGVTIADTLPTGVTFQSASVGCIHNLGQVVCTVGGLAATANINRTIVVRVNPSTTTSPLTNSATADSTTNDPIPGNNTATVDTIITTVADLQLGKSGLPGTVIAGNLLTYTLSLANAGPSNALGVTIADQLPPGVTFQSASVGCNHSVGQVVCTVGTLAASSNINRTIVVRVNASTITTPLTNSATADSITFDPVPGNNTATVNTTVTTVADLRLIKSAWPSPVIAGNPLTYTLSLANIGPSDAQNVIITDTLPSGVTFQSASVGCNYTAGQVICQLGSMAAQTNASRIILVRVNPSAINFVNNFAIATSSTFDPTRPNQAFTSTPVITRADLAVSVADFPEAVPPGGTLVYTIQVTNFGPSNALSGVVTSTLPTDFLPQTPAPSQGSCVLTTILTCNMSTLLAGQTANVVLPGSISPSASPGTIDLLARATSSTTDPNPSNNQEIETTFVSNEIADLKLTLVDSPDPVIAGSLLTYQAQVTNLGPSMSTGVSFTSTIPSSSSFVSVSFSQGFCDFNIILDCNLGAISVGGQVTVIFQVSVNSDAIGSIANMGWTGSLVPDSNTQNNVASTSTTVQSQADVWVTQIDQPDPVASGAFLTYTLTIGNDGPSDAVGIQIVDTLPSGVQFISSLPGSPTCFAVGNIVTCNLGNLVAGATTPISILVQVNINVVGAISNQAVASSFTVDVVTQNNTRVEETEVVDEIAPVASWVLPVTNTERFIVFDENVLLQVNASDNVGISRVVFSRYDSILQETVIIGQDTIAPYEWVLDATTLNFEWNQVNALAYDTSGNVSVFSLDHSFIWLYRTRLGYQLFLPFIMR